MAYFLYPAADMGLPESYFELATRTVSVGRHPNNDISLLLESVSRFHAKLELDTGAWVLQDLNSSNGTFVDNERIEGSVLLGIGCKVTFGRAEFTFTNLAPSEFLARQPVQEFSSDSNSSAVSIVGDEESSSLILSTQLSIDNPLLGLGLTREDLASLKRANDRLMSLYRVSEAIRNAGSRTEMMAALMDQIFAAIPVDRAVILTRSEAEQAQLNTELLRFRDSNDTDIVISRTIVSKVLNEGIAVLSRDAKIDSRFSGSESIMASDMRSTMCVPIRTKLHILGVVFVDSREVNHVFTDDDLAFLSSCVNDLAMTLDNLTLQQEKIHTERLAAVGQTIAGLAHNIKNILQLAKGGIELMDSSIQREKFDEVSVYWPIVRRGVDRMQSMTQEMLDYSRQTRPALKVGNVNAVVDETISTFLQDKADSIVQITAETQPGVPDRLLDADGLFKALMNLLSNSVDAFEGMPGKCTISTHFDETTIYVKVADNGKGIPKDKQAKIFQPFFSTKGSKGTGLGLPMTKKYVEDMFGQLKLDSEEGVGTTFTIVLPLLSQEFVAEIDSDDSTRTDHSRTKH